MQQQQQTLASSFTPYPYKSDLLLSNVQVASVSPSPYTTIKETLSSTTMQQQALGNPHYTQDTLSSSTMQKQALSSSPNTYPTMYSLSSSTL